MGGCVRDSLLGLAPGDWDVATSALPEETAVCFAGLPQVDAGKKHGTVAVVLSGQLVEITTYRVDGAYSDSRHPDGVAFSPRLEDDLSRRDFTVNAMAWHPRRGLVDPFGGREDLSRRMLRCVGDPRRRFGEDALRGAAVFCASPASWAFPSSGRQAGPCGSLRALSSPCRRSGCGRS